MATGTLVRRRYLCDTLMYVCRKYNSKSHSSIANTFVRVFAGAIPVEIKEVL
jgi:hypothetical protein